jgi:hypothetical protein
MVVIDRELVGIQLARLGRSANGTTIPLPLQKTFVFTFSESIFLFQVIPTHRVLQSLAVLLVVLLVIFLIAILAPATHLLALMNTSRKLCQRFYTLACGARLGL